MALEEELLGPPYICHQDYRYGRDLTFDHIEENCACNCWLCCQCEQCLCEYWGQENECTCGEYEKPEDQETTVEEKNPEIKEYGEENA